MVIALFLKCQIANTSALVEGCCVTIEKNENDVVAIALVAPIIVVVVVVAPIVVVPLATITSQKKSLLKIIFNLTF